ncbi:MAG: hypothetical protein R3C61_00345 [Bacteroidia bacterium]
MRLPILPPPPKPQKLLVLLFCLFLLPQALTAQTYEDVLYLKNGWILRGKLDGSASDSLVKIETHDRNYFVFPYADVLRAEQQIMPQANKKYMRTYILPERGITYRDKGYFILVQAGSMMGSTSGVNNENPNLFNPHLVNGYHFNRYFSAGAGVGVNLMARGTYMPVFLDLRGDVFEQKMTPHYYGNLGYSIPLFEREVIWGWWGEPLEDSYEAKGGILAEGGGGIKIHTPTGLAWLITAGYRIQSVEESYLTWGEVRITEKYTFQRITLQVGVMF